MKIILPFVLIAVLLSASYTLSAQQASVTYAVNHSTAPVASVNSIHCSISNGRVLLKWNISNNHEADQFEVESSTDGKKFSMAALVFGTDKENSDDYFFFEKAKKKKAFYRVKIISKDKSIHYSDVVSW